MPGLTRNTVSGAPGFGRSRFKRFPTPGGETAQQASADIGEYYGSMPIPATAYVTSRVALHSMDVQPSVKTVASNASIVDRHNRLNGLKFTGGRQNYRTATPQQNLPVRSSFFQSFLMGPHVNYILNNRWYIAYPAATVMLGGMHNMAWSEKVPQLPTRTTGGPGPSAMGAAPRFKSVQTVPRYSTMPTMYNTSPTGS